MTHFTKGLEILRTLPDTPTRARQELALHTALGPELMAIKGYAASEVEYTYARARVLCQQVGDTPQLFSVLYGLWQFYALRGATQIMSELGAHLLQLAHQSQDPALLPPAYRALGASLFMRGELLAAREHLERGIAASAPQRDRTQAMRYGADPGVMSGCFAAYTLWALGYPDQAWQRSREALARAQEVAHPLSQAHALALAAELHRFRREATAVLAPAEAAVTLASEQEFVHIISLGTLLQAWAMAAQGRGEEALARMQHAVAVRQTTGAVRPPHIVGLIAEIYGYGGQPAEGLRLLDAALVQAPQSDPHWYSAELYRLKGELLLAQEGHKQRGVAENVAASFCQALDVARQQQAKSWELRAATSLARLWQAQDRRPQAYELLAPVYAWFTEGFETAELQDAKALLAALS